MAKSIYDVQTVELQDGVEVTLRPNTIAKQKLFMRVWGETDKVRDASTQDEANDMSLDIYIRCAAICLSDQFADKYEEPVSKTGKVNKDFYAYLEDVIDNPTAEEILSVCGGLMINDPKFKEAMMEAQLEALRGQN